MHFYLYETLILVGIYLTGFLSSSLVLDKEKTYFIATISLLSGLAICFCTFFPLIFIFEKISLTMLCCVGFLEISLLLIIFSYKYKNSINRFLGLLISTLLFAIVCSFFESYDLNLFCGDTFHLSKCAKNFSLYPELFKENMQSLSSWGAVFLLIQQISYEVGQPYFLSFQPLMLLSFVLSFQALLYKALIYMNVNRRTSFLSSFFSAVILLSSAAFLNIALLLHSNSFLIYYLFLFVAFYWMGEISKEKRWYYFSYLFMLLAAFSRVEGPIYCTIFLFCMLFSDHSEKNNLTPTRASVTNNKFSLPAHFVCSSIFFLLISAWYFFLYIIGSESEILSHQRALFLGILFLLIPILFLIIETKYFKFLKNNFLNIAIVFAVGSFLLMCIVFSDHLVSSLKGIVCNVVSRYWRGFLVFMAISLYGIFLKKSGKIILDKSIMISIFLMTLSIIIFSLFRQPFYKSIYDSSNRLLVALIPIAIFYLTLKFNAGQKQKA